MADKLVLVAGGDGWVLDLLQMVLGDVPGVRVLPARTTAEALAVVREARPTLALLDLAVPGVGGVFDGWGVIRQLRADPAVQSMPVIALTDLLEERSLARDAGCQESIEKPFDIEDVLTVACRYLRLDAN